VGYVGLAVFGDSSAAEISRDVDALLARGMRELVLDLRANPAGTLQRGLEVSDLFLNAGQRIVITRGRTPPVERVYQDSTREKWPSLPLTVLVDGRSANAAEIVAGALQDHDRAAIVGRPTYGSGSAQSVFPLGAVGGIRLTTARWFTPSGRLIGKPTIDDEDEDAINAIKLLQHKKFRTDSGRAVYGVGGITPDVLAGDTVFSPVAIAFGQKLGAKTGAFRDELAAFAKDIKARRAVSSPDFAVTPAMREELWRRLQARGVLTDRAAFDQAEPLVSRLLGYEIARSVFGVDAEFRRRSASDAVLAKALRLAQGVKTERDLLRRAELDHASSDSSAAK
jgi:carboxyl-terminal processing protease